MTEPLHTYRFGPSGPARVLAVHGLTGHGKRWAALFDGHLSDVAVVAPDLIGHGRSSWDAPWTIDANVAALAAVVDADGGGPVTVVGHSFGADVAVELSERSERVGALVIVTQAPDYSDANLPRGNRVMTVPVVGPALHSVAKGLLTALVALRRGDLDQRRIARRARDDFTALNPAMFRVILVDRRRRMAARPLDAQVRAAGKPTLVLLGGRDHFYGARSADRYRAAGARVQVLPESGHSPLVENPEVVTRSIREFVAERTGQES